MPELPEVETIVKGLRQTIVWKKVKEVQAIFPKIVKQKFNIFKQAVAQKKIMGVRRRGKYLLIDLSGDKTILVHLGMTGNFLFDVRRPSTPLRTSPPSTVRRQLQTNNTSRNDKHNHLIFSFLGSDAQLYYNDQRKFGKIKVFNTAGEKSVVELKKLGPEPLEIKISEFMEIFKKRRGRIKSALLNQQIIAGLGNIYADESLFEAKIHPAQRADLLSENKLKDLHKAIKKILHKAIKAGGSSIENYCNIEGEIGSFQLQHKIYGREGERCKRCGAKIKRIKINQRSSYFCPKCQPVKD